MPARHEGRSDDAKGNLDAIHLQNLDECLFSGHAHVVCLPKAVVIVTLPAF